MKNMKHILTLVCAIALLSGCVTDNYPIKTCIVSDEALNSMGEPYVYVHEGVTVKFCCKGCLEDFQKDPKKYLAKLKPAAEKK